MAGSHVYVADSANNRIERFNLQGGEAMQWGSKGSGAGQFSYPRGVAANEGEVIVSDDDNHRVERFDPNGVFQGEAGTLGTGPGQFSFPYGVALDAAGDVYVADDFNHRIVKLTPQLAFPTSGAGRLDARPARLPASAGKQRRRRNVRGRHGQPPHSGVRPQRRLPAQLRRERACGHAS